MSNTNARLGSSKIVHGAEAGAAGAYAWCGKVVGLREDMSTVHYTSDEVTCKACLKA